MKTTEHIGLKKPDDNDFYNVQDINDNMDIIDEKIHEAMQLESGVTGVKGSEETEYRTGMVEITPENIGLGNVLKDLGLKLNKKVELSNTSVNDVYETGIYISSTWLDSPFDKDSHGTLIVFNYNGNDTGGYFTQIFIEPYLGSMKIRQHTWENTGWTWTNWAKIDAGIAESANAIADYSDPNTKIQIGWRTEGLTVDTFKHFAAYMVDRDGNVKIKDLSLNNARSLFNLNRFSLSDGVSDIYTGDLNDIEHNSIYNVNLGSDKNSPYDGWGFVITMVHNYATTHISQIWVGMTYNKIYYRYKSGSWIGWQEMASVSDITKNALLSKNVHENEAEDFNNYKTTGIYHINHSGVANNPTSSHGVLYVEFFNATPYQIWIPDNGYALYKRIYTNGAWSNWVTMGSAKGIEFQIVNGKLQYRYDTSVWG